MTEKKWKVLLSGIEWDEGDGEYDASDLPLNVEVETHADTKAAAIESAMEEATDTFGFLINGVQRTVATRAVGVGHSTRVRG